MASEQRTATHTSSTHRRSLQHTASGGCQCTGTNTAPPAVLYQQCLLLASLSTVAHQLQYALLCRAASSSCITASRESLLRRLPSFSALAATAAAAAMAATTLQTQPRLQRSCLLMQRQCRRCTSSQPPHTFRGVQLTAVHTAAADCHQLLLCQPAAATVAAVATSCVQPSPHKPTATPSAEETAAAPGSTAACCCLPVVLPCLL